MECESFVLCFETQNITIDLKLPEGLFDFSNFNKDHEILSSKNNW